MTTQLTLFFLLINNKNSKMKEVKRTHTNTPCTMFIDPLHKLCPTVLIRVYSQCVTRPGDIITEMVMERVRENTNP